MNTLPVNALALAVGIACGGAAFAQNTSRQGLHDGLVATRYRLAKEQCDAYAGSAHAFCLAQAKARYGKT